MRFPLALLALLIAAILPGCASARRHQVIVALDDALVRSPARPTIQVDVVGLTDAERRRWDEMPLSSYWMPGSPLRESARDRTVQVRFGPERSQVFVIEIDSDIWTAWKRAGAGWLYIVANLPGGIADKPGAEDPRRLAISLASREWADDAPLRIEVRRDSVVCVTPRASN